MCGIVCVIERDGGGVSRELLTRALERIRHRGPDQQSTLEWENVGLAAARLSIVDIAGGNQPLFNEDESLVLVYNGEIYNYQKLRQTLEQQGHRFRSRSDGEVIIHLYEEWGDDFLPQLDGMFALALLDRRSRRVIVARDRIGIKPLYFSDTVTHWVCCSEIRGITATGLVAAELNREGIFDSFTFGYIPGTGTLYREVRLLPPASAVILDLQRNSSTLTEYWAPKFGPLRARAGLVGPHAARFREIFIRSVESQTIGDVPIGAYLSGGVDSTATAAVLVHSRPKLDTFSIAFSEAAFDESAVFSKTAELLNFKSHVIRIAEEEIAKFPAVVCNLEQPQFSPLDLPLFLLSHAVREEGMKVVLSGEGSDELFGGYFPFVANQIRRALSRPFLRSVRMALQERVFRYFGMSKEEQGEWTRAYAEATAIAEIFGFFPPWYPLWRIREQLKDGLFIDPPRSSLAPEATMAQLSSDLMRRFQGIDEYDRGVLLELKTRLPNYILTRSDKNSMAHSVELRVPFLGNEVVEFTLSLAPFLKMLGLRDKYLLRSAMKPLVPRHVLARQKQGYDAPNFWLWRKAPSFVDDYLSEDALRTVGIFDAAKVRGLLSDVRALQSDYRSVYRSLLLTGVLTTQILAREGC